MQVKAYAIDYSVHVQLAQKCPIEKNAISRQTTEIFLQRFQDLQQKEFSTILENFTKMLLLLQELQLLQYFILYFKITPKKWTVTCNVQRSTVQVVKRAPACSSGMCTAAE